MNSIFLASIVIIVQDIVLAGDVDVGDVIVLPDADEPVLVTRVRLGRGGLIFTVAPAGSGLPDPEEPEPEDPKPEDPKPEEERLMKLTAKVRMCKRGRDMAF